MSTPFPLSPGQAVAVAAVLDAHPRRLPHWHGWAEDLRTWAVASTPVEAAKARRAEGETRR